MIGISPEKLMQSFARAALEVLDKGVRLPIAYECCFLLAAGIIGAGKSFFSNSFVAQVGVAEGVLADLMVGAGTVVGAAAYGIGGLAGGAIIGGVLAHVRERSLVAVVAGTFVGSLLGSVGGGFWGGIQGYEHASSIVRNGVSSSPDLHHKIPTP